jgi:transposase InsO family protein
MTSIKVFSKYFCLGAFEGLSLFIGFSHDSFVFFPGLGPINDRCLENTVSLLRRTINWQHMENTEESQEKLDPVIIDGNDIIEISGNEIISSDNDQCQRKAFELNVQNYRNSLTSSMQEKSMITIALYNDIMKALKCGKGGKKVGIDVKFYSWCKTHFKIILNVDMEILCSKKNGTRIAMIENYYEILKEAHLKTGHGGRDKMRHETAQHYYWIPSKVIDAFLPTCVSCQVRKPLKLHVVPTAIIFLGFMTRLQMDLIDMRTRPDGEFKWILHCRDHFTKYSWGYAMPSKEAHHVAENLLLFFYQFGPCKILQSDNGKEFTAQIIKDLKKMWPGLIILNGLPRHPQTQGLVERGNSTLCDILGKLMHDRNTNHWTSCLLPAIYSMNTSLAQGIRHTPFEIVFGQKPRVDLTLWQSIAEQNIEDEDDLPQSIREQLNEAFKTDDVKDESKIYKENSK